MIASNHTANSTPTSMDAQEQRAAPMHKTRSQVKLLHVIMLADVIHQGILAAQANGSIAGDSSATTFSLAHSQPDPTHHDRDQSANPPFAWQLAAITDAILAAPKRAPCTTLARDLAAIKDTASIAPSTFGAVLASVLPAMPNTRKMSSRLRVEAEAQVHAGKRAYVSACILEWFEHQEHGRSLEWGGVSVRQVGCSVAGEWDPDNEYKDEGDWCFVVFAGHLARPALVYAASDARAVSEMTSVPVGEGEIEVEEEGEDEESDCSLLCSDG